MPKNERCCRRWNRPRAEQKKLAKETGPRMGQLKGAIKKASDEEKPALEQELATLERAARRVEEQSARGRGRDRRH